MEKLYPRKLHTVNEFFPFLAKKHKRKIVKIWLRIMLFKVRCTFSTDNMALQSRILYITKKFIIRLC